MKRPGLGYMTDESGDQDSAEPQSTELLGNKVGPNFVYGHDLDGAKRTRVFKMAGSEVTVEYGPGDRWPNLDIWGRRSLQLREDGDYQLLLMRSDSGFDADEDKHSTAKHENPPPYHRQETYAERKARAEKWARSAIVGKKQVKDIHQGIIPKNLVARGRRALARREKFGPPRGVPANSKTGPESAKADGNDGMNMLTLEDQ
ncbi:hypothetical protein BP6252_09053 [Coleophoma cylindrospora]|uniref:Uncharacterized protein n=1 Tax=Coleophoma cylindrospora TaxID=1849047 RepID=A0A3D8R0U2_9HELO|nr:hypothetical protein BP6252_09053 [Coleophoma cylindrospora]